MEGWVQVTFQGGSLDGQQRYCRYPVERGSRYHVVVTGEAWEFNGSRFVLVWDGKP